MKFKPHPYADLFPMMTPAELDALAADIAENGQQFPVILDQHGLVLDGRNRLTACERAGRVPLTETRSFDNDAALLAFIVSANDVRRHLDPNQRAMIAARICTLKDGQKKSGMPRGIPDKTTLTMEEAAEKMDVSRRQVGRAKKVQAEAVPEIQAMVESGDLPLRAAAEVAVLSVEEQEAMAPLGAKEIRRRQAAKRRQAEVPPANGEHEDAAPPPNGRRAKDPVGISLAHEALNILKRVPKDDPNRENGYRLVIRTLRAWLRSNQ